MKRSRICGLVCPAIPRLTMPRPNMSGIASCQISVIESPIITRSGSPVSILAAR